MIDARAKDPAAVLKAHGGADVAIGLAVDDKSFATAYADLLDVFALHAAGRTRVIYETRPLASVNESIAEVLHGKAEARIVMTP